jgi:hypothetical protein
MHWLTEHRHITALFGCRAELDNPWRHAGKLGGGAQAHLDVSSRGVSQKDVQCRYLSKQIQAVLSEMTREPYSAQR